MSWSYRRPVQPELGQTLTREGWKRGDTIDAGQRLLRIPGLGRPVHQAHTLTPVHQAHTHPDLFDQAPSFDLAAWLKRAQQLDASPWSHKHAGMTGSRTQHRTQLTPELVASSRDPRALQQLADYLGRCELAAIALGRIRQLDAIARRGERQPGPRFDLARIPTPRLQQLAQTHPDLDLVDRIRAELQARTEPR